MIKLNIFQLVQNYLSVSGNSVKAINERRRIYDLLKDIYDKRQIDREIRRQQSITVKELIIKLQTYDEQLKICYTNQGGTFELTDNVIFIDDGFLILNVPY